MPWTFAHPAAILPLRSLCPRWLSLPALIVGSLAPDLSYYVGMHARWSAFCHTALGVVTVCLPVSLLLFALLQRFARPLTVLLPVPHREIAREQLHPLARAAWQGLVVVVASILLGATSHVVWDAFTHAGRWGASLLPLLDRPLFVALDREFQLFNLLQHLSTAVGVAAIATVYCRALRARCGATASPQDTRRRQLLLALFTSAAAAGATAAWVLTPPAQSAYVSHLIVHTVVWSTSCLALLFVLASLAWWRRHGDA